MKDDVQDDVGLNLHVSGVSISMDKDHLVGNSIIMKLSLTGQIFPDMYVMHRVKIL